MRDVYFLTGREPLIAAILERTFPGYTGKTFRLNVCSDATITVNPHWEGGTHSEIYFLDLDTLEAVQAIANGRRRPAKLPPRIAAVEHRFERGRDLGITIHVDPKDVSAPLLPERVSDLTPDEHIVLRYTARYKASYGRNPKHRQTIAHRDTGITLERWNVARDRLVERKLLTRQYAITPAGRNEIKS